MTYPYPPQGQGYPVQQPPVPTERNVVGIIALIAGILGFIFACIPGALIVGWVLLPVAFVLGVVGVCLSGKDKGTSIAAICLSIVGVIVGVVVFFAVVANSFEDAFNESDLSAGGPPPTVDRPANDESASKPGSRTDPLRIGEPVSNKDWTVVLGQPREAWSLIEAENQFNDPPDPGMEFWMVPIRATYTGSESGHPMLVSVKFVGADNRTYSDDCGVIPNPLNQIGELYSGGVAEGNACVQVPAGADGLWTVTTSFGDPVFFK
ncbi:hypothetical protein SAMN04489835_3401 [Mycolicibacterium rutilum]|uniref:DUF4190 domain-containing protein n=1 Tax=Mycolicibacterium rutilum TaxID=370526 RepID=A0A1H6KII7_MYCRU|nr:hypothetical protein [Mycolicibacterium rutilum]SEH73126.1 hypothetical protein SAMN04489835_3401 [Mycolicibacterium rutilum]